MHQRTVTSRPRQQLRREKIFRPTKDEGEKNKSEFVTSSTTTTTTTNTTTATTATTISTAAAPKRGGPVFGPSNTFRLNYSSPDRSRTAIIIKHRDAPNNSARSRSRDGGPRSKLITIGKTEKDFGGGSFFNSSTPRKRAEGSPAKILPSDSLRSDGQGIGEHTRSYLEEPQLSKLVSRVLRDDERDRRLSACRQLRDYLQHPENAHVVQKMGLSTVQELVRVYFDRTALEVKEEVAQCAGIVASTLGRDMQNYLQWLFRKYESTSNEEAQVLLLQTLHETMKWDERKQGNNLESYMPMIMTRIQSALEVTDSQPLLVAIVDIVLIVAHRYSDTFHSHFHDTVDILVGWHIDPQQSESIIQYTSDALIQFHEFWVNDISFSITLLGQFLEDIEAYAEEHSALDDIQNANEDLPGKIASLIRVYSTVVRSLKDYFNPERSPLITLSFIAENFSRLLSSVLLGCSSVASEVILMAANDCVALLLSHLKDGALPHLDQITSLIQLQMDIGQLMMDTHVISLLKLTRKVVIDLNCHLPAEFLGKIIGSDSLFPYMKFWPNVEIKQHVLELYRAIFGLKTVALLEEAYKHVLSSLHVAFKSLLNWNLELPFVPEGKCHRSQALTSIVFDLCAIAEIGNTKNSLIAMLALNPSIFDLLTTTLRPLDVELAINYPTLQYAITFTLYSHCKIHSHFLSSSGLINASESLPADRPTTSGHFTVILDLLNKLLRNPIHNWDVRVLALNWTLTLMESVHSYFEQLCSTPSFIQLLHTVISVGFNCKESVNRHVGDILSVVLRGSSSHLPRSLLMRCLELCLLKMADNAVDTRNSFAKLSTCLPLGVLLGFTFQPSSGYGTISQNSQSHSSGIQTLWQMRRRLQSRSPLETFTSQDFRTVMNFILLGIKPTKSWLKDMFAMDQRAEKLVRMEDHTLFTLAQSNEGMLWFWCIYETSLFCILSKLRTPLGKPQETLATIELAVKGFASEILSQTTTEGQFNEIESLGSNDLSSDPFVPHLRGKLLLDFLELLEKFIYNAYEGCAIALLPAPKAVKTFFRTNKATCQEWLARVRKAAITLALHLGHPAIAVRHGYQLLWDLSESDKLNDQEFHQVAVQVVQALLLLGCPDAILGLYAWAKEELKVKLTWMKAAVDMAAGRYENAAHEFSCILNAMSKSKDRTTNYQSGDEKIEGIGNGGHTSDSSMSVFVKNQILECYRRIGDWSELTKWLASEQQKSQDNHWPNEMHTDHIKALATFDGMEEHFHRLNVEEPHTQSLWHLNPRFLCQKAEVSLMKIVTTRSEVSKYCQQAMEQVSGFLRINMMESPIRLQLELATIHHMTYKLIEWTENQGERCSGTHFDTRQLPSELFDMAALIQALRWMKCAQFSEVSVLDDINKLQLVAARSARKQLNLHVAQQLMFPNSILDADSLLIKDVNGEIMCEQVQRCREGCKLLHSLGNSLEAVRIMSSNIINVICKLGRDIDHVIVIHSRDRTLAELNARSLLTIVKWIQLDPQLLPSVSLELRDGRVTSGSNGLVKELPSFDADGMDVEVVTGRLLWMSTKQCPWLAKAWSELAAWCYRAGKREVDKAGEIGIEINSDDREKVEAILPKSFTDDDVAVVCHIVSQIHCSSDEQEKLSSNEIMSNERSDVNTWRRETLLNCSLLQSLPNVTIDTLLALWRSMTNRVYAYYRVACEAYFTFLKLNGSNLGSSLGDSSPGEDGNVIATLRLLRLMVKHASELRDVLEVGLANTPTAPWKGIIPQLFARLNHPESYVRRSISDLLCRVTAAAPHLIVFPAVVGSSAVLGEIKDSSGILGECLSQPSDDGLTDRGDEASQDGEVSMAFVEENQQKAAVMQNCFAAMVDTLAKQDPRTIAEVQRLVHELRRITLLWDEFWLGTLNQYHVDFGRRISQLEKEIGKVKNNSSLTMAEKSSLIVKKHNTFLKPTLFVLEQLQQVTSQVAETPHEEWFQQSFGAIVEDVIKKLKNPSAPEQPQLSWQLYKQLLYSLQQRVQKRSNSVLNMTQISPVLSNMKATSIAMPGAQAHSDQIVTIQAIDNTVSILPTKTKPKKLVFYGSDGKKYSFLFKGLEDLHLDERIMQLLSIVNNMFDRHRRNSRTAFRARHYTVTPLGPRSGLIQWVEGATPLFGLYKRWQQREAMAPISKTTTAQISSVRGGNQNTVMRPSDIYYSKLTPLLKEKGITNLENRKEWPLTVLRQVLMELMVETPHDLLAKELWCASTSALEWWSIVETYTQSTAVMSVIGYIIGLGDRHLDNVLVDLETGEVVHIDYNVCFEKGKNLRVPEKVPFRMTPNIKTALGFTGVEGPFRVSCEHVLKTLRRGRETLLTLLEAFVYDPLIDWTPGNEGGYTGAVYGGWQGTGMMTKPRKQDMERLLVYSMFNIRMVEMKAEWISNRDELLEAMPKLQNLLNVWSQSQNQLQVAEEEMQELHQQMAFLKEAEANPSHPLHTLHQRCADYLVVKDHIKASRMAAKEKLEECERWHQLHKNALDAVQGQELAVWRSDVGKQQISGVLTLPPVVEFLQAAGKGQLLQQCEQAEKEIAGLLSQQQALLSETLDTLATYATIISQSPVSYVEESRNYRWQQWLKELCEEFTVSKCQEIISKFHALYGPESMDMMVVRTVVGIEYQLQQLVNEYNAMLHKLLERLHVENLDGSLPRIMPEESKSCIANYVLDHGKYGAYSLACVIISALGNHSRRLGVMESAALAAGDRLADYTSRDGDWFLDEIYVVSANIDELVSLLYQCKEILGSAAMNTLKAINSCHQVVASLQELHLNFRTIILPEAVKCLQRNDTSVQEILHQLDSLVASLGTPLPTIVQQLELQVRNVVMEMEPPVSNASHLVEELKSKCKPLLEGDVDSEGLSSGQMLLMGFNGLFTKLEQDFWHFRETSIPVLATMHSLWRKVDLIKEAHTHLSPSFLKEAFELLSNIFFVKRVQAVTEFFNLVQHHCWALKGVVGNGYPLNNSSSVPSLTLYNEDIMTRPVRSFIAEFIGKMMLGLPTQGLGLALCHSLESCGLDVSAEVNLRDIGAQNKVALEDLCRKAIEACLRNDSFQPSHLAQANTLVANWERGWRKQILINRCTQNIVIQKSVLQRAQLQLAYHQWINEDLLMQGGGLNISSVTLPTRSSIMTEIRKKMQGLMSMESNLSLAREHYLSLGNSVEQRLRWAAGANPSVATTLEDYEHLVSSVNQLIVGLSKVSSEVSSACSSILHFEALRSHTSEALSYDSGFLQLINRCQESCLLEENCHSVVTPLEEKLLQMKLPDKLSINSEWITSVTNRIASNIGEVQKCIAEHKADLSAATDNIKSFVMTIRSYLSTHHRLMNEIRAILKSLTKYEDQHNGPDVISMSIRQYVSAYRVYSEHITVLVKEALAEDLTVERVSNFLATADRLKISTVYIYDSLIVLSEQLGSQDGMDGKQNTNEGTDGIANKGEDLPLHSVKMIGPNKLLAISGGIDLLSGASPASQTVTKVPTTGTLKKAHITRDPRTGKAVQERNSYAVSVWKRVKMKLDGRDPDANRRSTVPEQVDYIIKEATSLDNLATLYEGWTPWV